MVGKLVAGVALVGCVLVACGQNAPQGVRRLPPVSACGHVMWTGEQQLRPQPLGPPPAGVTATAPARSELPVMGQTGGVPRLFVVSARCQGAVVRVSAPDTFRTYAVARAADGAVTALTLTTTSTARPGTLVIEAFQHGRLTGYFQTSV